MRQGNLLLTLRNESGGLAADVYKTAKDPNLKVVPDYELQVLLDVFAEDGLFASAAGVPLQGPETLQVEQSGGLWAWSRPSNVDPKAKASFHQARQYFLSIYNGNVAYHGSDQRPNFSDANSRAKADSEAARQRLLQLRKESR